MPSRSVATTWISPVCLTRPILPGADASACHQRQDRDLTRCEHPERRTPESRPPAGVELRPRAMPAQSVQCHRLGQSDQGRERPDLTAVGVAGSCRSTPARTATPIMFRLVGQQQHRESTDRPRPVPPPDRHRGRGHAEPAAVASSTPAMTRHRRHDQHDMTLCSTVHPRSAMWSGHSCASPNVLVVAGDVDAGGGRAASIPAAQPVAGAVDTEPSAMSPTCASTSAFERVDGVGQSRLDHTVRFTGPKWVSVTRTTRRPSNRAPSRAMLTLVCRTRGVRMAS